MLKRLIIFLVRKKLGLQKHEYFQFVGQKTGNVYYFGKDRIFKMIPTNDKTYLVVKGLNRRFMLTDSNVSLNWLLNDECEIKKI